MIIQQINPIHRSQEISQLQTKKQAFTIPM